MGEETIALESFLGDRANEGAEIVIPKFSGGGNLLQSNLSKFSYPGNMYSDRDTRSAFHLSGLLHHLIDPEKINLKDPAQYDFNQSSSNLIFILGSKSNDVTQSILELQQTRNLFSVSFTDEWTIHSVKSGKAYAIKSPPTLSREEYENSTDYGIIVRYLNFPESEKVTFVLAGLGGRATEGCGIFFAHNWKTINSKFGGQDVAAVVLKFKPPVDPNSYEIAEWII